MLGQYYADKHDQEHFMKLYDYIPDKESISGKTILSKLDTLKENL